jgi:hypothetical protein
MTKKMTLKLLDVESTGLTSRDEVTQISIIETDLSLRPISFLNEYCFPNVEISPKALEKTKVDRETLLKYSKGQTFEQIVSRNSIFHNRTGVWIYYSSSGFDLRMINTTLESNGFKPLSFGERLGVMPSDYTEERLYNLDASGLLSTLSNGIRSLEQMSKVLLTQEQIEILNQWYLRAVKVLKSPDTSTFHNSLYDVFLMWYMLSVHKDKLPYAL